MKVLALALVAMLHPITTPNPFYADKTMPGSDLSCCKEKDCRAVAAWRIRNKQYQINMFGRWHKVPQHVITEEITPDGNAHACYKRVNEHINWFCVFIPIGMI